MKRKWMLIGMVALAASSVNAGSAAAANLYVGDAKNYSVTLKASGERLYAIQLAGLAHCYYTEPRKNVGSEGFSIFPAPRLMRRGPRGFVAGETFHDIFGTARAWIRADLDGGEMRGAFSYEESESSYHCDTGFFGVPFEASRHVPFGNPRAAAPDAGDVRTYYGDEGRVEIFLRATKKEAAGIRGTFAPRCPLGRGRTLPARHALFGRPAFAKRSRGRFSQRVVHEGRAHSGGRFKETISIDGRMEKEAVTGTYLRVRTVTPGGQKCVTGPLPFRAVRYLPLGD